MFSLICTLVAVSLAAISAKQYRFIAYLVAIEFALHLIAYNYLFLDFRSNNSSGIYFIYILIQVNVLWIMYKNQTHFIIAGLIFINLTYNFLTILQHLGLTSINFHDQYILIARTIMILELIYLLGITSYVGNYIRKHTFLDINYIDNLFFIRRRLFVGNNP